jgi:uncharacterized protein YraI
MTSTRLTTCVAALILLSAASASAEPAYVPSTVNLRTAAGTTNEIVTKIPGGSLVDVASCTDGWCEVTWKGKNGFAIATALDRSGRVPAGRPVAVGRPLPVAGPAPLVVEPAPVVVGGPLYYPYRPYYGYGYYGPRYYGYRRWRRW